MGWDYCFVLSVNKLGHSNREVVGQGNRTGRLWTQYMVIYVFYMLCDGTLMKLTKFWLIVLVYCFRYPDDHGKAMTWSITSSCFELLGLEKTLILNNTFWINGSFVNNNGLWVFLKVLNFLWFLGCYKLLSEPWFEEKF